MGVISHPNWPMFGHCGGTDQVEELCAEPRSELPVRQQQEPSQSDQVLDQTGVDQQVV